jgi:SAM-dependent methyltransferase
MWALYGARYASFFWNELMRPGRTVEFGSGPMPVLDMAMCDDGVAVDTLGKAYKELGLYLSDLPLCNSTAELADEEFDSVFVLNVLDHSDDPEQLMREAARVVKPKGSVLVFVHVTSRVDDKHSAVTMGDAAAWVAGAGLEIVRRAVRQASAYDPPALLALCRKV